MSESSFDPATIPALLIDSSPDGILAFDRQCRYTIWNAAMEKLSGVPKEQVLGRCAFEIFPFLQETGEDRFLHAALAGQSLESHEQHYAIPSTGKEGYFEGRYSPLRDARGEVIGGLAIIHDVTARKRAEQQVRSDAEAAERRFRTTFDQSPLSMQMLAPDGRTIRVNQAWQQLWGLTLENLANYNMLADQQLVDKGLMPYIRKGFAGEPTAIPAILYNTEESLQTGLARWVTGFIYPLKDDSGEITEVVVVHEDVSARKAIEELHQFLAGTGAVLVSSLDYETTLKTVANLVVPFLADWCIIDVVEGEVIRRVTVNASDPAKQEALTELQRRYPPTWDSPQPATQALREKRLIHFKQLDPASLAQLVRDTEHFQLMQGLAPQAALAIPLVARGHVVGVMTLAMSESGRIYRETDIAIAEEVARRAAMAIDNARLYQEVEESSRTKDQFLAVLSHELRTPLTAILGWSNLLRAHRLEEKDVQAALDSIARNANSQAQLVEDLLEVSRIVTGKFYVDLQECDLSSLIKNAVETVQLSADAKEISLSLSCPASPCRVCGDQQRLQQVALNLLSNAIKFTPPNGRINVTVQDNGSMVELSVSDTGQGISAEFLPHVFDRFRQSDSSVTREFGGLGLGLSIVKHIVDLHSGAIEVTSEGEGKGATFTIRLPQATA
jgi:PAS domain S-box-containing protein